MKRMAWAIAWKKQDKSPARLVDAHGGPLVYFKKRDALIDIDPAWQKVVRVEIRSVK